MTNYNYIVSNRLINCHSMNLVDNPVNDSDYDIL